MEYITIITLSCIIIILTAKVLGKINKIHLTIPIIIIPLLYYFSHLLIDSNLEQYTTFFFGVMLTLISMYLSIKIGNIFKNNIYRYLYAILVTILSLLICYKVMSPQNCHEILAALFALVLFILLFDIYDEKMRFINLFIPSIITPVFFWYIYPPIDGTFTINYFGDPFENHMQGKTFNANIFNGLLIFFFNILSIYIAIILSKTIKNKKYRYLYLITISILIFIINDYIYIYTKWR